MKSKNRTTIFAITLLVIGGFAAVAYMADRRPTVVADTVKKPPASQAFAADQLNRDGARPRHRNLSLQPEALAMARRLGTRFGHGNRIQSTVVGTLTIGTETRVLHIVRTQTDEGEEIEINPAGRGGPLRWNAQTGALASAARAQGTDRELIERLVFDSPDQFVLAQLRGASYSTIARRVRPTDAGESYAGPLWDIVRVDDPERDEQKKPQSTWRLYYINNRTGLIDRIVSQLFGETIEAEMSDWTTVNGENVPGRITWRNQSQTLMQYRLTSFSRGQ